jgi:hypothetical protein
MEVSGDGTILMAHEHEVFLEILAVIIREVVPGSNDHP